MIKIGFVLNFNKKSWLGGYNYYKNFFYHLNKYSRIIEPVIITDNKKFLKKDLFFKNYKIYETILISRKKKFLRIFQKILVALLGYNFLFIRFLKKKKINALSHDNSLGIFSSVPSFPWFPDFQELHLPENFSFTDKFLRRLNVYLASLHSTKILVSSKSVQNDLMKISKRAYIKSQVIKHTDMISNKIKCITLKHIKKIFRLNKNYFVICDQFWKHKNHIIALKALNHLKNRGINFLIVCTGNMYDRRHPKYISDLKKYIEKHKLKDNFKVLGIVKERYLISLIKHSICLLKTSKSEGLSNSVEQAKNLGKRVILSNIPVHKEQKTKDCYFFKINDYTKLARLMVKINKISNKNIKKKKINSDFIKKYINLVKKKIN